MAMEYLQGRLRETGDPKDKRDADFLADMLARRGADVPLPDQQRALDMLAAQLERQALRYQELSFHKLLQMPAGSFKDRIMHLVSPQPEAFRGRFDIPVVVVGQADPIQQATFAEIDHENTSFAVSKSWDWRYDPKSYTTPNDFYLAWMQDGRANLGKTVEEVRFDLAPDERAATIRDGIALHIARPQAIIHHNIDLPGTILRDARSPVLVNFMGARLGTSPVDVRGRNNGSATCGRAA